MADAPPVDLLAYHYAQSGNLEKKREYLRRAGDLESGLQMYGGAADEPSAQFAGRVLSERARLDQLLTRRRRSDA